MAFRNWRYICNCVLSILFLLSISFRAGASTELAQKHLKQFKVLTIAKGTFQQNKYFKILKKPIVSNGVIYFDQTQGLLWQTTKPVFSEMLIKENELLINDGNSTTSIDGASAISNIMLSAVTGNFKDLTERFTLSIASNNNCVQLTPVDDKLRAVIYQINLCGSEHLTDITIFEAMDNRTEISLQLSAINALPEEISAKFK